MKATITLIATILFFFTFTFSQRTSTVNCDTYVTIMGIVLDEEAMAPLIGANVSLINTNYGAATDIHGI